MKAEASTQEGKCSCYKWGAALLFLVAYYSPSKFPGLSGWVGAGGFLLLSFVVFTTPELVVDGKGGSRIPLIKYLLILLAICLIVASVVVWSVEQ